ncbi:MAG: hypothetical protein LBS52_01255, partial [Dysgonamonadaceae bacterium]|nr:hypothetical protein [Dysgonamonadaceae bacterium]
MRKTEKMGTAPIYPLPAFERPPSFPGKNSPACAGARFTPPPPPPDNQLTINDLRVFSRFAHCASRALPRPPGTATLYINNLKNKENESK